MTAHMIPVKELVLPQAQISVYILSPITVEKDKTRNFFKSDHTIGTVKSLILIGIPARSVPESAALDV